MSVRKCDGQGYCFRVAITGFYAMEGCSIEHVWVSVQHDWIALRMMPHHVTSELSSEAVDCGARLQHDDKRFVVNQNRFCICEYCGNELCFSSKKNNSKYQPQWWSNRLYTVHVTVDQFLNKAWKRFWIQGTSGLQVVPTCPKENWPLPTGTYPHMQKWVSMAASRKSKPPELISNFTFRYKRCFRVSHSMSVFMYCIHSTFRTWSIATYVLNVLDILTTENSEQWRQRLNIVPKLSVCAKFKQEACCYRTAVFHSLLATMSPCAWRNTTGVAFYDGLGSPGHNVWRSIWWIISKKVSYIINSIRGFRLFSLI